MNHKDFAKKMSDYTVLYIEDDKDLREHIDEFLKRYCKKTYACENTNDGLTIYNEHKPDILLLDINLPGMNGIDFAELIRKKDKRTRIVMFTAYTDRKFMLKAIELELSRYLVKPVTNEELFSAMGKCVDELEKTNIFNLGNGYTYSKRLTSVISNNEKVTLRKKEMEILEYFIAHEGEVIRYDMLEDEIWDENSVSLDAIRSQMRNLRKKLGNSCFETIVGVGYKFEVAK